MVSSVEPRASHAPARASYGCDHSLPSRSGMRRAPVYSACPACLEVCDEGRASGQIGPATRVDAADPYARAAARIGSESHGCPDDPVLPRRSGDALQCVPARSSPSSCCGEMADPFMLLSFISMGGDPSKETDLMATCRVDHGSRHCADPLTDHDRRTTPTNFHDANGRVTLGPGPARNSARNCGRHGLRRPLAAVHERAFLSEALSAASRASRASACASKVRCERSSGAPSP